jgi:glutathione S-transferase
MSKQYTLHGHFASGPTYKVALMLNLLKEPFAFQLINLREGEHKKPDYLSINRYGQVPCLHDGEQHFNQSASILQYLADKHGKFGGKTPQDRAHIREWMFWEFDRLAPGVFRTRAYELGIRQADPAVVQNYRADGEAGLAVLDQWLANRNWLVGDEPTIADIDVYGVVHLAPEGKFDFTKYPNVSAWTKRIEALPGYISREGGMPKESRP